MTPTEASTHIGRHSELLTLAALTANGTEIALPFGNQGFWDFLYRENGSWLRAQVKTALGKGLSCRLARGHGTKSQPYTADQIDVFFVVCPETGAIWKFPVTVTLTPSFHVKLLESEAWLPPHSPRDSPLFSMPLPTLRNVKLGANPHICSLRTLLKRFPFPDSKPARSSTLSWDMILKFRAGFSMQKIADQYGIANESVHGRIRVVIKHILHDLGFDIPDRIPMARVHEICAPILRQG